MPPPRTLPGRWRASRGWRRRLPRPPAGESSSLEGIRSAIDELIHASAAMTRTFDSINEKTGNIDKVITAITKVANRTNLLSLNAAIEAEKAGEKAGGFSVVAVEMRRLADQTAVAALDIEKQIREVQHAVRDGCLQRRVLRPPDASQIHGRHRPEFRARTRHRRHHEAGTRI